jgi:dynein heavy chain
LSNEVPKLWQQQSYLSLYSFSAWLSDLKERVAFFRQWCKKGDPAQFWLGAFFFPRRLLAAVAQTFARKSAHALDVVFIVTKVRTSNKGTSAAASVPDGTIAVTHLYLEGAAWSEKERGGALIEATDSVQTEMPPMYIIPGLEDLTSKQDYACPVYKTSLRQTESQSRLHQNFVSVIPLPCGNKPDHWVLRGTAIVLQRSELTVA